MFSSFDGCSIAYRDAGTGPPVLLLHGALVDTSLNWELPGVIDHLVGAGFRVVAADARGHGASGKPHDPVAYAHGALVKDVIALVAGGTGGSDPVGYDPAEIAAAIRDDESAQPPKPVE